MGDVTQAVKKRLSIGIVRRNEIIRLIERGINTAYSIAKAMDLDPGTVKHHLDWLEEKGLVESEIVVEKGRAKRIFRLTFPAGILEKVMEILDLIDVDVRGAEKEIARLVLEVVEGLEEGEMSFDEADRIFTALLALKTVELSDEVEEMLTLANELHDGDWETVAMLKSLAYEFR
jgi:predicted ArsR family transcriptional regulator